MAVKKATNTKNEKLTTSTVGSRPYSSPNATTTSSNSSRPYSSPNTTASNVSLPSSLPTGSAYSTVARNTVANNNTRSTSPQTVASQAASSVLNNTAPVSNYVATPSTPSVSTPSYTPSTPTPSAPSVSAASASLNNISTPTMQTGSLLGDLANPNIRETNPTIANMNPSQTTDLMLSLLGSQTADSRLSNSNPAARNAVNNLIRRNNSLDQAISNAAYQTLVDSADYPNANAPYSQVPNIGGGLAYSAILNPDAIVRNTTENPNSLQNAIEDAVRASLISTGTVPTAQSALEGILNPEYAPYGLTGGFLGGVGDINVSAEGGDSDATGKGGSGGTGGRSSGGSGGSGVGIGNGYMDVSSLYDLLNQRLAESENNYNSLLETLNANYGDILNALGLNYADSQSLLDSQLNASRDELENARRRALQEAYISRMMQEKNLADQLDAYGLTGGASESVMANMRNNYANNRNEVEQNTQNNLRELLLKYLENVTNARQGYNDSLLKAQSSRLSDMNEAANYRSRARAEAYEDLYNTLANLTMKGINYGS